MSSSTLSLNEMGFQICDPTCFFEFNGQLHLGLALSERDWFHAQKFADLLVTLPEKTPETLFMTAKPYVPGIEATKFSPHSHSIPLLNVSTDVGQKHPFGVLRTHKREGAAVKDLKITRHRFGAAVVRVELHYKAHEGSDIEVGVARLDVPDGQLQTMSIPGSNGEVRHLEFSVDPSALEEPLQLHVDVKPFEIEFKNIRVIYDQIDG
ncbi:MAG: hypothetical protein BM559_12815 [Roseobacter sp. MedPE-SWchi]|nr:MAG: hypothetical protein BM559_12815 [Roseobacter sp. MedPE-SWchi]